MYGLLRSALFRLDAERAHHVAAAALAPLHRHPRLVRTPTDARLAMTAFGCNLPSPLGIAAGFDKEGRTYNALLALGFGHVELGTVTPRPQPGNPRPRIERFPEHRALVNRMGFPGPGAAAVAHRLRTTPPAGLVGANIGPNKTTPAAAVHEDLALAAAALAPHAAYLAVNVSSPNTPGLRDLQEPRAVARLVGATLQAADDAGHPCPVLLKLHPDAADEDLVRAAASAVDAGASGIIATNTTQARPPGVHAEGGLSGAPLAPRALAAVQAIRQALPDTPIVAVGGIDTAAGVLAAVRAGASTTQCYTGFIYQGPAMARRIQRDLIACLDDIGVDRLEELVGVPPA